MDDQKFIRAERGKYSLEEKKALGELCKKSKNEYDAKADKLSKKLNCNDKMKKAYKSSATWAICYTCGP